MFFCFHLPNLKCIFHVLSPDRTLKKTFHIIITFWYKILVLFWSSEMYKRRERIMSFFLSQVFIAALFPWVFCCRCRHVKHSLTYRRRFELGDPGQKLPEGNVNMKRFVCQDIEMFRGPQKPSEPLHVQVTAAICYLRRCKCSEV